MLIFVAFGWTITFLYNKNFDLYLPLSNQSTIIVIMLGLVNVILTILTKLNDGEHDKYHMHDTVPSYILLYFRFMSLGLFLIGIFLTYRSNKANEAIASFMKKVGVFGSLYFLSLPLMVLGCFLIHISSRKWVIFVGQ